MVDAVINQNNSICYLIGKAFYEHKVSNENVLFFETFDAFTEFLKTKTFNDNTILIKGSRGMALEQTLEYI